MKKSLGLLIGLGLGLGLAAATLQAQTTYTWTQTAGGAQSWEAAGNWQAAVVPDPVSGDTIRLDAVDIAANTTLTLGADRTAEVWKFGDLAGAQTWTVNAGNLIVLAGTTPTIRVARNATTDATATLNNVLAGSAGLTKTGVGTLALGGDAVNTFTGGLHVNGGTLLLDFANLGTPTDLVGSSNALAIGGSGILSISGKSSGTTGQTLGNLTLNAGGGAILGNKNGGSALDITLGALTATAKGGSLRVGAAGTTANLPVITTTSGADATGIYGGRLVYFNGTAATGYDWVTSTGSGASPYTLSAYGGYVNLDLTAGTDASNSRITDSATLSGSRTTNSLKFAPAASGRILDLGGNTLTISSGGLLITGASASPGPRVQNGTLTAGADSNYDLVVHQYNATATFGGAINNNTHIFASIANNDGTAVTLVKAGTGALILSGANTFTGGIVVNDGGTLGWRTGGTAAVNNNSLTFNANTIVLAGNPATTSGGITINNGSQIEFRNNTQTFTVNGAVTGEGGGITLGQDGGGATRLVFNSTANTFTGPIRYAVTAQEGALTVGSLADSTVLGEGNITFGVNNASVPHNFNYGSTADAPLVLNNRQLELTGTGNNQTASINNNSSQALTINTDLISSLTGTTTKNLTLGGTGAGLSTFAGTIPSGGTATINLVKNGSGTWVLSGNNEFNGTTTVSAGTLVLAGGQCLADDARLTISGTTTKVHLNAGVRERVGELMLGAALQAEGIWGASDNLNVAPAFRTTFLTGTGLLYVNTDLPPTGTMIMVK